MKLNTKSKQIKSHIAIDKWHWLQKCFETLIIGILIVILSIHLSNKHENLCTRNVIKIKYNIFYFFKQTRHSICTILNYPNERCTRNSQNLESVPLLIMSPTNIFTVKRIWFLEVSYGNWYWLNVQSLRYEMVKYVRFMDLIWILRRIPMVYIHRVYKQWFANFLVLIENHVWLKSLNSTLYHIWIWEKIK